jgi:hypothetical protein
LYALQRANPGNYSWSLQPFGAIVGSNCAVGLRLVTPLCVKSSQPAIDPRHPLGYREGSHGAHPMLWRLLNIASVGCLVACVLLIVLWVRSYTRDDYVSGPIPIVRGLIIRSIPSRLDIELYDHRVPWQVTTYSLDDLATQGLRPNPFTGWGFGFYFNQQPLTVSLPFWFLVTISATLSAVTFPWKFLTWRFTLRHLFIATTFLAVVLGMIAWLDRAWIGQ